MHFLYRCFRIYNFASRWLTIIRFSLFHWLYTQNGLNLFSRWQHSKKMLTKRERHSFFFFASIYLKNSKKIHPTLIFGCKKGRKSRNYLIYTLCCGERGIRTPGTVARSPHFECGPIDHSGISPIASANIEIIFYFLQI